MRAPLSWLREFAPIPGPTEAVATALNDLGLEVEEIDEPGREIGGVVAARVLDVLPHPDADRLRLVDVDFGLGETRVVCGAPNVEVGMIGAFAPSGATLPGGFVLERRKIRGQVSDGMLCSARELGLGDDHTGILHLPTATEPGVDVREVLGLDDVVFDLSITPNRPDAMGIVGVARDLAAHFGLPLTVPVPEPSPRVDRVDGATVEIDAPDRCPRFVARVARVRIGPSPDWMQRRLTLAGMRPISNVVDVTNYVMLERCRPLHAFDLDELPGHGVVVRLARDGEVLTTLDGVERRMTADDLLICDAERRAQSIAGIMGGARAEVSDSTTRVLLESAHFEPQGIARTSKRLGLRSEASARFERGVDPEGTLAGADHAMALLAEVASAEVVDGAVDVYPAPVERPRITVRTPRVNAILGTTLTTAEVADALRPLGIDVEPAGAAGVEDGAGDGAEPGAIVAVAPTFRPDLGREIDVIEEVARRVGLNRIPRTVPTNPAAVGALTPRQRARRVVQDVCVGAGCDEAYTLPLVAPSDLARWGADADALVEVANPLRAEESVLRPRLLPGLVASVAFNASHGNADVALFETGHVFRPPTAADPAAEPPAAAGAAAGDPAARAAAVLPDEPEHLAVVLAGVLRRRPVEADRPVLPADVVGVVLDLADALGLADVRLEPGTEPGFQAGRTARVFVDGVDAGVVGELAPELLDAYGLSGPAVACEVDLDVLTAGRRRGRTYAEVSRFPPSNVDLAFVVDDRVPAGAVRATLAEAGGPLLEHVALFDVFRSDALGPGRVSLAFALRFRAPDHTLTDDEVGRLRAQAIEAVQQAHGAQLRG